MLEGTCHCGAVRFEVAHRPPRVTECNCSLCRRLGALWAYYRVAEVRLVAGETSSYAWGDRTIAFHRCGTCGCVTHYTGLGPEPMDRVAVNARLLDLDAPVPVSRFDGATSWERVAGGEAWPWPVVHLPASEEG